MHFGEAGKLVAHLPEAVRLRVIRLPGDFEKTLHHGPAELLHPVVNAFRDVVRDCRNIGLWHHRNEPIGQRCREEWIGVGLPMGPVALSEPFAWQSHLVA